MGYEQIEQKILNQAIEENNIDKICNVELAWGAVLGIISAYNNKLLTIEKADEIIDKMNEDLCFSIDFSIKEMWEEWKKHSL